jgi:hypothetical protein
MAQDYIKNKKTPAERGDRLAADTSSRISVRSKLKCPLFVASEVSGIG